MSRGSLKDQGYGSLTVDAAESLLGTLNKIRTTACVWWSSGGSKCFISSVPGVVLQSWKQR